MKSHQVFRTEDDTNRIVFLAEWDNLDSARRHIESEKSRQICQQLGLPEMPETYYLEQIEKSFV